MSTKSTNKLFDPNVEPPKFSKAPSTATNSVFNWSIYSVAELSKFRDDIDKVLPATRLKDFSLEQQMLLQYHTIRELQASVIDKDDIPPNQLAQVANSVASSLKTLGDMQVSLYNSERFKEIENLLIRTLEKLPESLAMTFIADYERILTKYE